MMFARFKALMVAGAVLVAAALTTPSVSNAAPVSSGWSAAAQAGGSINADLFKEVRKGRGRGGKYGRGRGHGGGYGRGRGYRGGYGRGQFYGGPSYYRPARYYRPVRYGRPVRCRIVYQNAWNGFGYIAQPVRVCRRW